MNGRLSLNATLWIVGTVIVIGLFGWAIVRILNRPVGFENNTATSSLPSGAQNGSEVSLRELPQTYTNTTYGFSVSYPAEARTGAFVIFHALRNNWRVNAPPESHGTPLVAIPVLRIDNSTSTPKKYPLFFDAEVRVGVSDDTANCYRTDEGYTMQTVADVNINGVTWKKFIFGDAATMEYLSGASYRTIHNNRCFAVEQVRTGSTYSDETMLQKYSDEELDSFYAKTTSIVMSFRFTE